MQNWSAKAVPAWKSTLLGVEPEGRRRANSIDTRASPVPLSATRNRTATTRSAYVVLTVGVPSAMLTSEGAEMSK